MPLAHTAPLRRELASAFPQRPFTVEFWDGTRIDSTGGPGPTFTVRSPRAVAHALRAPGQLGLGRAYVSGELEVDDIDLVIGAARGLEAAAGLDAPTQLRLAAAALAANGLTLPPTPAAGRAAAAGSAADEGARRPCGPPSLRPAAEFFSLFLDESMTYSCAIFSRGATTLEEAQEAKLEMVCRKLGARARRAGARRRLRLGQLRRLMPPTRHGVEVVGITLSEPQAESARERAADAGVADRVEIRVMDYRDLTGGREAIRRDRQHRHGRARRRRADRRLRRAPGGAAGRRRPAAQPRHRPAPPQRPRGGAVLGALRLPRRRAAAPLAGAARARAGRLRRPSTSRASPPTTPRRCATGRGASTTTSTGRSELAGPERVRVWRLYLRAARNGFESGFTSIYQVRAKLA